nr:hypothetical protein [Burkholderia thailandensis]
MDGSSAVVRCSPARARAVPARGHRSARRDELEQYAFATIAFNALGVLFLYALLRVQGGCPAIRKASAR